MKKRITIANGALNYLHSILESEPARNMTDARKQRTAFTCLSEPLQAYTRQVEAIQKANRDERIMKDAQGNEHKQWIIPEEKKEAYEKDLLDLGNTMVAVDFDRESFTVVKVAFDGIFDRPETKEKGYQGETQMKFIDEIARAFETATEI